MSDLLELRKISADFQAMRSAAAMDFTLKLNRAICLDIVDMDDGFTMSDTFGKGSSLELINIHPDSEGLRYCLMVRLDDKAYSVSLNEDSMASLFVDEWAAMRTRMSAYREDSSTPFIGDWS